jgi:hypothetical protein
MHEKYCPCLGTVTKWLKIDDAKIAGLLWAIAAYLFVGGILVLYDHWRSSKFQPATATLAS